MYELFYKSFFFFLFIIYTLSAEFRRFFRHLSRPPATGHRSGHRGRGSSARSGRSGRSGGGCRRRRRRLGHRCIIMKIRKQTLYFTRKL